MALASLINLSTPSRKANPSRGIVWIAANVDASTIN
jgi:hypothetical protein